MLPLLVLMGVSGSGKSTVGIPLAVALGVAFVDADDLHPESNVRKMARGHPLTDDDRLAWLCSVGEVMREREQTGVVVACSALKRSYREVIRSVEPQSRFVLLEGSRELLMNRLSRRRGHFMPASLLDSQLGTLEPFGEGDPGIVVSVEGTPEQVVQRIVAHWEE